jgi:hypothetical protein
MCRETFKAINVMQTHQIIWSIDNVTSTFTHAIEDLCLETNGWYYNRTKSTSIFLIKNGSKRIWFFSTRILHILLTNQKIATKNA